MGKQLATIVLMFSVFSAGTASTASAQLLMKGSDQPNDIVDLASVVREVIFDCVRQNVGLLATDISYVGGGSSSGQAALVTGAQRIAPMSRPINGAQCAGGIISGGASGADRLAAGFATPAVQGTVDPRGEQLAIGVDLGMVVLASNQRHLDSLFDDGLGVAAGCGDKITGITLPATLIGGCLPTDNCNADGSYTFGSWKEVLAMLFGGQNNSATPALSAAFPKTRQLNKINCASPVRKALADNWGDLFATDCARGAVTGNCKKLKHAFRQGDLSTATDMFVNLVGLEVAVPAFTTTYLPAPKNVATVDPDSATAHPFCNAGTNPMNKGDADYLDLDPIRRIADVGSGGQGRLGFEQVAEAHGAIVNPPVVLGIDTRPDPTSTAALVELPEFALGGRQNVGPNPAITAPAPNDFNTLQAAALAQRKGLGLVLPIEIPSNYLIGTSADYTRRAYWGSSGSFAPNLCSPGVTAPAIPSIVPGICPNGTPEPCLLPVAVSSDDRTITFNCLVNTAGAPFPTVQDKRVFNLMVFSDTSPNFTKYILDNYMNPNLPQLPPNRQARVVSAFFRLHATQSTNFGGTPTFTGTPGFSVCQERTSAGQIGCLVKANPCSIGMGKRDAVDRVPGVLNNMAYQLGVGTADARPPTDTNILALVKPFASAGSYPMASKQFVSHWIDPALPTPPSAFAEEILYGCFKNAALTNPAVAQVGFLPIPGGPVIDNACPNNR